jgi:hypothetical protein
LLTALAASAVETAASIAAASRSVLRMAFPVFPPPLLRRARHFRPLHQTYKRAKLNRN